MNKEKGLCMLKVLAFSLLLSLFCTWGVAQERVLLDFKAGSLPPADWQVEGYAFGTHHPVPGERQKAAVATRNQRYGGMGRMTSPEFIIDSDYLNITCAGTFHPVNVAIVLLVNGIDVRSCSPEPGYGFLGYQLQTEVFKPFVPPDAADYCFDVRSLRGKRVRLQLRDQHRDGQLYSAKIIATDQTPTSSVGLITAPAIWLTNRFETTIDRNFLLIPVGPLEGTPLQTITVEIDGIQKLVVDQPLAFGSIETVGYLPLYDLSGHQGDNLKVLYNANNEDEPALILVQDEIPSREISDQKPAFHIHNRIGLLNDPNGLVKYNGEYHLFHQFNYNVSHLDWAHYVSRDLMHWEERPIGLFHDHLGSMHSGSAAVDVLNTSGWQSFPQGSEQIDNRAPIILAYTSSSGHGGKSTDQIQTQCIAFSTDSGKTFTKFEGNPVLGKDQRFIKPVKNSQHARDPKVFWFSPTQGRNQNAIDGFWVMVLFEGDGHTIYSSPDLKKWEKHGSIKGFHECPELFPLAVDGDPEQIKWIMYGARGTYHIGSFDGREFKPETDEQIPMFYDGRLYASQTFNNTDPGPDGQPRRIQVSWQGGRKGQISLPNELTLRNTPVGLRVCMLPVVEIKYLYLKERTFDDLILNAGQPNPFRNMKGGLYDIELEADLSMAEQLILNIRGQELTIDVTEDGLLLGKHMKIPGTKKLFLRIVVDHTSQDIYFGDNGLYYSPRMTKPGSDKDLGIEVKGGSAVLEKCFIRELKSIW